MVAALTEGLAFPESGGPRWWLGQSQARCPRRGVAARTTSVLQTVQFQNPGDFRDRFWIREIQMRARIRNNAIRTARFTPLPTISNNRVDGHVWPESIESL